MNETPITPYMRVGSEEQLTTPEKIEAVAGYLRVSTAEQKIHGLSLESQRQKIMAYAEKHNLRIVKWYADEGISGTKPIAKRPALMQMGQDAQKGLFSRILFIKIDRFFRSVAEYHEFMKMISPVLWTATEEKYSLTDANGRAFLQMKLVISELESGTTGDRIRLVNDYKVKTGRPLVGTKSMPFCYEVITNDKKEKCIQKHSLYGDVLMDAIDHIEANRSIRAAVQYANAKHGTDIKYKQLYYTIKNPMIAGSYRGNPNYCDPFITMERFENLQKIITRNPRTTTKNTYLFSGLIVCPSCGRRLRGTQHHSKTKRDSGKTYGYRYSVYRCQRHRIDKDCPFSTVVFEHAVEEYLLTHLNTILDRKIHGPEAASGKPRVTKYDLEDLQQELDRLNYSWQKGRIKDVAEYDRKYDDLMLQIEQATLELQHIIQAPDYSEIESVLSTGWQETYRALDTEHKRAFWRTFIDGIHIEWTPRGEKKVTDITLL